MLILLLAAAEPALPAARVAALNARAAERGEEAAVTPLRVLPADPLFKGKLLLNRNPINPPPIAAQPLEALGAARAEVDGAVRTMPLSIVSPPGARVAGVPTDPARLAWCNRKKDRGDDIRCYQDRDGDGRFDQVRWGRTAMDSNPLTLFMLGKPEPLAVAIPYQRVPASELPAYRLIYQGCRVTDRIQYAARIGVEGDADVKLLGCPDAASPVGHPSLTGPGRYRVDRVVVDIAAAPPPAADGSTRSVEAPVTLVEPIAAGTLLDRIDPGKPVRLLGEREGWPVEQARVTARYERSPYLFAQAPRLAAAGAPGDVVLEGDFAYGYTARVADDASRPTMLSGRKPVFSAGEAVYGIPMRNPLAPQLFDEPIMMWCAPREHKPGRWRARCVQQQGVSRGVYESLGAGLWVEAIPAAADDTDAVEIVEGPADLPRARVAYRLEKWTKNRLLLRAATEKDGAREPDRRVELPRFEDGTALIGVGGGVVKLTETPGGGFAATTLRPFKPGGSAMPKGGMLMFLIDQARPGGAPLGEAERAALLDEEVASAERAGG